MEKNGLKRALNAHSLSLGILLYLHSGDCRTILVLLIHFDYFANLVMHKPGLGLFSVLIWCYFTVLKFLQFDKIVNLIDQCCA